MSEPATLPYIIKKNHAKKKNIESKITKKFHVPIITPLR